MKLIRFFALTLLLLFHFQSNAQLPCNTNDSLALIRLGNGFTTFPTGWAPTSPVSSWTNITLDTVGVELRVSAIDLSNTGLLGNLEGGILEGDSLYYLKTLDVSNNNISFVNGQLRTDLNTAVNPSPLLTRLDISHNNLDAINSGSLLIDVLSNLDSLVTLDATAALDFGGTNVWASLQIPTTNLKVLKIDSNELSGSLDLEDLINQKMTSLQELYLSNNMLGGLSINNPNYTLEKIYLRNNMFGDFSDIEDLLIYAENLKILKAEAVMDGPADTLEFALPGNRPLTYLELSNNNLIGNVRAEIFQKLPNIQHILLDNNDLGGQLPSPDSIITIQSKSAQIHSGLANLRQLDISNNKIRGNLELFHLLGKQLRDNIATGGLGTPLESIDVSNNEFDKVYPQLSNPAIGVVIGNLLNNRFTNFNGLDVSDNAFDFKDLYRLRRIFRMVQVNVSGVDHYVLQADTVPSSFQYASQDSIGIGGIKRRAQGDSVFISAGDDVLEVVAGATTTTAILKNSYSWERIDTIGNYNTLGVVTDSGTYAGATGNGYQPGGISGTSGIPNELRHFLKIVVDSSNHNNQRFTACITNPDFPNLQLCLRPKKVEVGPCLDASGNPIQCQTMIVQFKPSVLNSLTPAQQDSMKNAVRKEMGADILQTCLCGDVELWGISDTATAMVEGFGKGTKKQTSRTTAARPELQSADPNYDIQPANANPALPDSLGIQQGQGNSDATTLVAIIDAGIDYSYTALQPFISEGASLNDTCMQDAVWGYNFIDQNSNANDDHGHGTAIAGIVTGLSKQNLIPYDNMNVNHNIGILPLKYTDDKGRGSLFNATCALYYAKKYRRLTPNGDTAKVRVINCSWGYYGDPCLVVENAIKDVSQGCDVLVVASAGNNGIEVQGDSSRAHWPSNSISQEVNPDYDNVLSVTGIANHTSDILDANYANYGNLKIDMAAQGRDSSTRAGTINGHDEVIGTSFAAAQVSRAAALLFNKYPDANYAAIKYALTRGVDTLQSMDATKLKHQGRLNYTKANNLMSRMINRSECQEADIAVPIHKIGAVDYQIEIYPNPVQTQLNINLDYELTQQGVQLTVYNLQGQLLLQKQLQEGDTYNNISTQGLPSGIYLLHLQIGNEQISYKFIKQ